MESEADYQDWLYFDYRDLKLDSLICIDSYISEERDEIYKKIARLRYYEKKSSQQVSDICKDIDIEKIINHIRSRLILSLKSRGWDVNGGNENEYGL